jgi:hypothetical protein
MCSFDIACQVWWAKQARYLMYAHISEAHVHAAQAREVPHLHIILWQHSQVFLCTRTNCGPSLPAKSSQMRCVHVFVSRTGSVPRTGQILYHVQASRRAEFYSSPDLGRLYWLSFAPPIMHDYQIHSLCTCMSLQVLSHRRTLIPPLAAHVHERRPA